MAVSQNGWQANTRAVIVSIDVPGGKLPVRSGDVADIFRHLANRFHNEVEPLVWPGNWGYAERAIRGSTVTSNHASGTAIDLNAPRHPLGKVNTFTKEQQKVIRDIVNYYEGVIRWGGDYTGRKDDMHFEVNANAAEVARIAAKVRGGAPATSAPAPAAPVANADVRWTQERLSYWGYGIAVDGILGPKTTEAIRNFQGAKGLAVDGIVGPNTRAALAANKNVAPPFPLPRDHYFGLITGPARSHGGINVGERVNVRLIQQALIRKGYVPGVTNPASGWADGKYEQATKDAVTRFQRAQMPGTTRFGEVWWDDWAKLLS